MMYIMGIETSCDETACSAVKDGQEILSNIISSQFIHTRYGGVVPELASRAHIKLIVPVIEETLKVAGLNFSDIDGIAVTIGPGLIGALLVGVSIAKSLAYSLKVPLIGVNHLEGHIFANFLTHKDLKPPLISLIASGGHTELVFVEKKGKYRRLGGTLDDASGEAFDKVAKLLGLKYPGGQEIEELAKGGDPQYVKFPRANIAGYNFSYSGLKTSVLYYIEKIGEKKKKEHLKDIAASFQDAACDSLVDKTVRASTELKIDKILVVGGVARNKTLRKKFENSGLKAYFPSMELCSDNAAMIASCGYVHIKMGETSDLSISPSARLPL